MIHKFFICHINLALWQLESEIPLACDIGCELPKRVLGTKLRSTVRAASSFNTGQFGDRTMGLMQGNAGQTLLLRDTPVLVLLREDLSSEQGH